MVTLNIEILVSQQSAIREDRYTHNGRRPTLVSKINLMIFFICVR